MSGFLDLLVLALAVVLFGRVVVLQIQMERLRRRFEALADSVSSSDETENT